MHGQRNRGGARLPLTAEACPTRALGVPVHLSQEWPPVMDHTFWQLQKGLFERICLKNAQDEFILGAFDAFNSARTVVFSDVCYAMASIVIDRSLA